MNVSSSPAILRRPRLLDRLHQAIGSGLIVLHAPAGFGKSTLVDAFAGELDFYVAWVSLDASSVAPEALTASITRELSDDPVTPLPAAQNVELRAFLTSALRGLSERDSRPLLLVIDNTHFLARAVDSCELLAWLFDNLPDDAEVIVSGREMLPLTEFDRRVASGECASFGPEDLRFTIDETRELISLRDSGVDAAAAQSVTDGWPIALAGIVSGAVPLEDASSLVAAGSWERFIAREVWASVPSQLALPLLRLSLLPVIETPLANAIVGKNDWTRARRWLDEHGFLAERITPSRVRLNESFRRFLRTELVTLHPDEAAETTRIVARRLIQSGAITQAVHVAIEMDDARTLQEILENNGSSLLLQGAFALLRRAFEALGSVSIEPSSPLNGVRLRVLVHSGFPEAALEQVAALLRQPRLPAETRFHALLAQIRALRLLGRGPELTRLFDDTRESITGADPLVVADYYYQQAQHAMHVTAEYSRAEALLRACYEMAEESGAVQLALLARSSRGDLLLMQGNAPAAVDELIRAATGWRRSGVDGNLGWTLNNLGLAHICVGDFESATTVLHESREHAIATENPRIEAYAIATMADCRLAQGDPAGARGLYEEALQLTAETASDPTLTLFTLIGLSACALATGEIRHADFLANRALELSLEMENQHNVAICKLQLAATHSATGDHSAAEGFAREALRTFESLDSAISVRAAYYRLALVRFAANDRQGADDSLRALSALVTEPWMVGGLAPVIHENPLFAQWAASRQNMSPVLAEGIRREVTHAAPQVPVAPTSRFPRIVARSLGQLSVELDGVAVPDTKWSTLRAKELFFLFLAHPQGMRKEEAVAAIQPEQTAARSNSTFHTNLHRLRRALYHDIIVKVDNVYRLNPEAEISWDVEEFRTAIQTAQRHPAGSPERAAAFERATGLYNGPFAPEFFGEWADAIRDQIERQNLQTLSSLAGFYSARGEHERAAEQLELVLTASPYNEEAILQLALSRARAGNAIAAIGALDEFGTRIYRELGEPLPRRLRELRSSIASGAAV